VKLLPNNEVALKIRDPNTVMTLIPHARREGQHIVIVPHRMEETKILRNLGLDVPSPIVANYNWPGQYVPFDHQVKAASFATLHHRCFMLLDMGLGKSISSLWAADYLMREGFVRKALILSTLSCLDPTWQREIFRNMMHRTSIVVHGTKQQRVAALAEDVDFFVMNHHGILVVDEFIAKRDDIDLVIVDEAAMLRNSRTQIYRRFTKMLRPEQRVWMLTGKPCPNGPEDAWALARLVSPSRVPQFFTRWKDQTMRKVSMFKWVPREGSTQMMYDALQPSIRFDKKDCLDLPPVTYIDRQVGMSDLQNAYYQMMKAKLLVYAEEHQITAVNAAVLLGKLLQICCGAVRTDDGEYIGIDPGPRLAELDNVFDQSNAKVIVFVPYTGALRLVTDHLAKRGVVQIDGSTGRTARKELIAQFLDDPKITGMVAHPKVASHGLNLTVADTIAWFSPIHSLDIYDQANERMARPGQKLATSIVHLGGCALEWGAYKALRSKGRAQEEFLELFKQELHL
jgi:SNF2 family DNA or RNA helicase